ncbi:hypothetical protein OIE68_36835 [Nocardia vinacea]|uniref:Lipoprotein n=1 Tax=Nocardia vinacea TaxID=96468 RepID=A0ABZ1Z5N6_9NOCA|nr:hypothetical protein OIE68_36835 [Nocardia vinacea]
MNLRYRNGLLCLAIAAALATTAACGGSDDPAPAVDVSKLEAGNYPTTPRDIDKQRTTETGAVQESIRLAEFVPLMMDLDSRMIYNHRPFYLHPFTPQNPPRNGWLGGSVDNFAAAAPGLVAGWTTSGHRRKDSSLGLNIDLTLLRFSNNAQAKTAMDVFSDEKNDKYPGKGPLSIPGYPNAKSTLSQYDAVKTWIARDDYLLYTYVGNSLATPPDPAPLIDFTKMLFDKQFELLKGYTPTPSDKVAQEPADIDGLVARTLANQPAEGYADITGAYTPHAALHLEERPDITKRAFDDAEVDLIAHSESSIYRTADPAAANRLTASFLDQLTGLFEPTDSPPGLPTAKCSKKLENDATKSRNLVEFICYLTYDRYVATITANQRQDLDQKLAAQYKLLAFDR